VTTPRDRSSLRASSTRRPSECTSPLCSFFFNDTATTEIYTLSLHDALPIFARRARVVLLRHEDDHPKPEHEDRKSTRLNSSHVRISYAVFCLKKNKDMTHRQQSAQGERHSARFRCL